MAHINAGAKKVVISAPAGNDLKTIVYSVNEKTLTAEDQIVSSDVIGMRYGSLFDATQTMVCKIADDLYEVQVVAWYDNENSYTSQMVRTIKHFGSLLGA